MSKSPQKISLRLILILPFILQLFSIVGLIGWLSWRNGQKVVSNLATQLQRELGDRIEENIFHFLHIPHNVHDVIAASIQSGNVNVEDLLTLEPFFLQQIQTNLVPDIFFANPEGDILGIQKKSDGSLNVRLKNSNTSGNRHKYLLNESGQRTEQTQNKAYDTLARPWYKAAIQAKQPIWTDIYPSLNLLFPEISAVRPIYNKAGDIQGVLGSELTLEHISNLLQNLEISPSGQAFIMERNGALVASSTAEAPFLVVDEKEIRVRAQDSQNPRTRATARYLLENLQDIEEIDRDRVTNFKFEGKRHIVWVESLADEHNIDWLVVIVVPESDFMTEINANTRTTIALSLGALILATIIGIYTARWVTKPLLGLSQASEAIADGKLQQEVKDSKINEIDRLSHSFNRMARQLRESFQELETVNQELEVRVKDRTADLNEKNEELGKTLETLKITQTQMIVQEKLASLGSLTAGIAHEIKNPLNFVNNFAELSVELSEEITEEFESRKEELDSEFVEEMTEIINMLKSNVSKIEHHGKRADRIVSNMLIHSRNGKSEWVAINPNELIHEAIALAYHGLRTEIADLAPKFDECYDDAIVAIMASPQDLNRVFINIANNAYYAMHQRQKQEGEDFKPKLSVWTHDQEEAIEIRIRDNGIGITPQVKAQIFEQFFTTKPTGEGTGLGLSLSYNIIVEQHQGAIAVESELGLYTEFIITLPKRLASNSLMDVQSTKT